MSGSPQWCLSLRFPHQNPVHAPPLPHTRHMPRPYRTHTEIQITVLLIRVSLKWIMCTKVYIELAVCVAKDVKALQQNRGVLLGE